MRLSAAMLVLAMVGCAGDDNDKPQEPVQPGTEATPYPDDPAMAPPASEKMDEAPGMGSGTDSGEAAKSGESPQEEPKESETEEMTGSLTDDPFGAPKDLPKMKDDAGDDVTTPEDPAMPPPEETDYQGSFQGDAPEHSGSAAPSPPGGGTKKKGAKKSVKPPKASAGKVQRYVDALALNVRSGPNQKSPIVRRLLGGAKINVQIKGDYAKIKNGQWVKTKYLSESPTKKVTQAEVDEAWSKSQYKDTWKPQKKKSGKKK